jgi:predicted ester cyclase
MPDSLLGSSEAQTARENAALARRILERFFNGRDEEVVLDALDEDFTFYFHTGDRPLHGRGVAVSIMRGLAKGFPDFRFDIQVIVADETTAMCRSVFRGTHNGWWQSDPVEGSDTLPPTGFERLPPTGRTVALDIVHAMTIRDGRVAVTRVIIDAGQLPVQLGVLPQMTSIPFPLIWIARVRNRLGRRRASS